MTAPTVAGPSTVTTRPDTDHPNHHDPKEAVMRRITLWVLSTLSVLVLLFSYRTSTSSAVTTAAHAPVTAGAEDTSGTTSATAKTYAGDVVSTRFGNVQVEITVANGKVTLSQVLQVPWNNGHDQQINSYAVPILNKEAVAAQDAGIDMVSGATYTSQAYVESLQSALDAANL